MKVFLSWSGPLSHGIAKVFREWLPAVIQSITPYVSSEDIDKGARWSTDIAKELNDSTFAILCVTRDNINAAWLNFEAGALSKTMDKSLVSPFLFDIKRSEVNGPILQFQSTIFEREDIKKLVISLNKACDKDGLSSERLEKTFNVWYTSLESELNKLKSLPSQPSETEVSLQTRHDQEILEEILELSRDNQKLLRSPETTSGPVIDTLKKLTEDMLTSQRMLDIQANRRFRVYHLAILEDIIHFTEMRNSPKMGIRILLGVLGNDYPWIRDVGSDTLKVISSSRNSADSKNRAVSRFSELVEFTFEHPTMREITPHNKDMRIIARSLIEAFTRYLDRRLLAKHD